MVLIEQNDLQAGAKLDADIRAYYEHANDEHANDAEDDQWAAATSALSEHAWDE